MFISEILVVTKNCSPVSASGGPVSGHSPTGGRDGMELKTITAEEGPDQDEGLVGIAWVSRRLGVTERYVRRLIAERRIGYVKLGGPFASCGRTSLGSSRTGTDPQCSERATSRRVVIDRSADAVSQASSGSVRPRRRVRDLRRSPAGWQRGAARARRGTAPIPGGGDHRGADARRSASSIEKSVSAVTTT